MASQSSKRQSRKRRRAASDAERRAQREIVEQARAERLAGGSEERERKPTPAARKPTPAAREPRPRAARRQPQGERPKGMFGGVPVSEIAILAGIVTVIFGYARSDPPTLLVGVLLCTLGVVEFTAREHFSGYRSHATLLAAIPAVATEFVLVQVMPSSWPRATALIGDAIVFAVLFWLLRRRFAGARQRRLAQVAKPPQSDA